MYFPFFLPISLPLFRSRSPFSSFMHYLALWKVLCSAALVLAFSHVRIHPVTNDWYAKELTFSGVNKLSRLLGAMRSHLGEANYPLRLGMPS